MTTELNEQLEAYILAHISPESDTLRLIDRRSHLRLVNGQMVSGHLQGRMLKMLVSMIRPHRVLELGTFTGYSALCMAEGLASDDDMVYTIEVNGELEDLIHENLAESAYGKRVRPLIGKAEEMIPTLGQAAFDLVFIDADKRHYTDYYRLVLPLVRPGGFILADNTLWYGHVIDPAYDRDAQTQGIRAFNDMVANDQSVETVILPLRDGLTLIRKKEENFMTGMAE